MALTSFLNRANTPKGRLSAASVALLALLGGLMYWWMAVRWQPPPSIFDTPVDDVMGYLALDDFSKLPLEERMQFLLDFADRFRGLKQEESAALAGFLAGLSGPTREQLAQNARLLAKDIFKEGAEQYLALATEAERSKFMDDWILKWMKTGERLTRGEERSKSDGDRLADVKGDFKEERKRTIERAHEDHLKGGDVVRMMDFWESDVQKASTPKEQGQILRFMKDLRNHVMK